MIRVAIADDHRMFIDGIKSIFAGNQEVEITVTANNGEELIYELLKTTVDVILVDADMPKIDGLELTQRIIEKDPKAKIIVLTMHNDKNYIARFTELGALGYVLKNTSKNELLEAIKSVFNGETFYSQKVSQIIVKGMTSRTDNHVQLSDRELDVLRLVASEMTTKEIAKKLFISENTVETHRKNLIVKLGAKNSIGLVKYAIREGIVKNLK